MRPDFNIFTAAKLNNATVIYHLLEKEQNNPNERNDVGLTPLHVCATFGSLEAAVILLEFGADLNAVDRESRWTPLHRSIYFRHFKLTLLFIKAGAMLDYGQEEVLNTGNSSSKATTATPQSAIRDYEGLTPMGLLSLMISDTKGDVSRFQRPISSHLEPSNAQLDKLGCIFAFGKADFQLGIALPKALSDVVRPRFVTLPGNESVSSISANRYHSLAVAGDGVVYSWGHGRGGRLGHGDETTQPLPVCIMTLRPQQRVIEVAAGLNHSLALTASGELFSWGSDRFGQLGHGSNSLDSGKIVAQPRCVEAFQRRDQIAGIAAGEAHSVCFSVDGAVYAFGCGKSGQLGLKPSELTSGMSSLPRRLRFPFSADGSNAGAWVVQQVSAAFNSTLVLLKRSGVGGQVFQCGNGILQLTKVHFTAPTPPPQPLLFQKSNDVHRQRSMMFGDDNTHVDIVQVTAGKFHNAGVTDRGHVYTWGLGSDQLGHADATSPTAVYESEPRRVEALLPRHSSGRMVLAAATSNRTCAITAAGDLYAWGATDEQGILGHGVGSSYEPAPRRVLGVKRAVKIATGETHTLVLTSYNRPPLPLCELFPNVQLNPELNTCYSRRTAAGRSNSFGDFSSDSDDDYGKSVTSPVPIAQTITSPLESLVDESNDNTNSLKGLPVSPSASSDRNPKGSHEVAYYREVPTLKAFCERALAKATDLKNVANLLTHAEAIYAPLLQKYCSEFINMNLDLILTQSKPSELDGLLQDYSYDRVVEALMIQGNDSSVLPPPLTSLRSQLLQRTDSGNLWTPSADARVDRSGSIGSDTGYKPKQNLDTAESVGKIIRAVRKKLSHIEDLESKLGSGQRLPREQVEKVAKRTALEAELARLQLIFNRLQGEESIVSKAKASREVSLVKKVEVETKQEPLVLEQPAETPKIAQFVPVNDDKPPSSVIKGVSSNSKGKKNKFVSIKAFESQQQDKCTAASTTVARQSLTGPHTGSDTSTGGAPLSFEAYAAMLGSQSPSSMSPITAAPRPKSSPWAAASASTSIPLSSIGPGGRTVLSPPSYNAPLTATPTVQTVTSSKVGLIPAQKAPTLPSSAGDITKINTSQSKQTNPTQKATAVSNAPVTPAKVPIVSSPTDHHISSPGLSLASFMPANSKVAKALNLYPQKQEIQIKATASPWGGSAGKTADRSSSVQQQLISPSKTEVSERSGSTAAPSSSSKKSLIDIQREEEMLRQQCATSMSTLTGHDSNNPWYVERRARAESMDEVIRKEQQRKAQEEYDRQEEAELQSALRAIELAERREQEMKQKLSHHKGGANKGNNKSQRRAVGSTREKPLA